jgi:Nucleotidyl transferase AbiEii toxin, Type IV TA system
VLDLESELSAILDALAAAQIEYALCGGLAMAVHGAPRATVDIDLLILPSDESRVYDAVAELGYRMKAMPMSFGRGVTEIRRVSKIDREDGDTMMLDLLLVTDANRGAWASRERRPWLGGELVVVSREGLIALKSARGSKQDLADIERLEE